MSLKDRIASVSRTAGERRLETILGPCSATVPPSAQSRLIPLFKYLACNDFETLYSSSTADWHAGKTPMVFPFPTRLFNAAPEHGAALSPSPDDYLYAGCHAVFVDWRACHGTFTNQG